MLHEVDEGVTINKNVKERETKMGKIGFDNEKYLNMQSEHIRERMAQFGGKLYMEFGGKLFDDYHASRVLPGFQPDSKLQMLLKLKDQAEIVIAVSASAIDQHKKRGDIGITYDQEVLRLIDLFRSVGLYVGSVVITQYQGQQSADGFIKRLGDLGVAAYMSDYIIVMKQGIIEDQGTREYILKESQNEYTRKLLDAVPSLGGERYV